MVTPMTLKGSIQNSVIFRAAVWATMISWPKVLMAHWSDRVPKKYKGHHGSHREAGGVEFFDLFSGYFKISRAEAEDPVSAEHIDQA